MRTGNPLSVKKRKQARALQDFVSRIPITNTAGLIIIYLAATGIAGQFEFMMEGSTGWWVGLVIGVLVGVIAFGALQKSVRRFEGRFKARLRDVAQKMETSADEDDKTQNKLLDAFELQYLGGHPGLKVSDKLVFGTLEIHEKSLVFKNKDARIKMSLARLRRISLETDRLMRHKKLPNAKLPPLPKFKHRVLKLGHEQLRKLQRYVLLDYQDDIGERHMIVFYAMFGHPLFGNPLKAKAIKAAIDDPFGKYQQEKKGTKSFSKDTGTGKPSKAIGDDVPREAAAMVPQAPPPPPPPSFPPPPSPPVAPRSAPVSDLRYQVSLIGAGSSSAEREAVAQQMVQLFGIPLVKAQAAVQRMPLVVKRNLTEAQADELYQSLSSTGARVSVEATAPAAH